MAPKSGTFFDLFFCSICVTDHKQDTKYEILWHQLRIRCIMVRCGQEETGDFGPVEGALLLFAFGELVLWIKELFIAVSELGLLLVF
jgi:hypothetical protein